MHFLDASKLEEIKLIHLLSVDYIPKEIEQVNLNSLVITETKKRGKMSTEFANGHTMILSGVNAGTRTKGDVGYIIKNRWSKYLKR